ncbi:MAG: ECF transporter S component [Anaerolineaceae bacterium]
MQEKKSLWKFGTKQVVYAAIGAALYAVLAYATNMIQLPGAGNVSFRPAVVIPMFFGIAFGPVVGFIAGFVGNILADLLSGYGFWFWWDLGNGLLGLVPGLIFPLIQDYRASKSILLAELFVVLGSAVGMGVASLSEMWVSGADMNTVIFANFLPAFIPDVLNGLVLVPLLMIAYAAVTQRSGRS